MDHEDRHPSRVRRVPRALYVRQRVHDALDQARDPRRDLLELPSVLHGPQKMVEPVAASSASSAAPPSASPAPSRTATHGRRRAEAALVAQRDAPIGGQAVLEGVMMRGVSTWAVAVRKPPPSRSPPAASLEPAEAATGEIEIASFPLGSACAATGCCGCRSCAASSRSAGRCAIGYKALGISANAQLGRGRASEISGGAWAGTVVVSRRVRGRAVLPRPGRPRQPDQGRSCIRRPVLVVEGVHPHRDLPRLPRAPLAAARAAPGLRVPRRRAQDDLLLRGRAAT